MAEPYAKDTSKNGMATGVEIAYLQLPRREVHLFEAYLAWHPDVSTPNTKACIQPARGSMCMHLFVALHHLILRHMTIGDHQFNRDVSGSTAKNMEEVPARELQAAAAQDCPHVV